MGREANIRPPTAPAGFEHAAYGQLPSARGKFRSDGTSYRYLPVFLTFIEQLAESLEEN